MKIDEHKKQELASRHAQWLQDPVTVAMLEIIVKQQKRVAVKAGESSLTLDIPDSLCRAMMAQISAWNKVEQLISDTDTFINNLTSR